MLRAVSSTCCNCRDAGANFGLSKTPMSGTPGASSRSSPSRFGSMRFVSRVTPVALPPGRLKLATRPSATGSPPIPNTIGRVDVARLAASGHAAAAPASSVKNWRRLGSSMGSSPEPAVPAYRRLRMPRKHPQVLGVDLNRSESRRSRLPLPGWSEARLDFADVGGFAADEEVVARRGEEIDHLCVFAEPPFVLRAP